MLNTLHKLCWSSETSYTTEFGQQSTRTLAYVSEITALLDLAMSSALGVINLTVELECSNSSSWNVVTCILNL